MSYLYGVHQALNKLIGYNMELGFLRDHLNQEQLWNDLDGSIEQANAFRQALLNLRKDLALFEIHFDDLTNCRRVIHDKLMDLALKYPLNKKNGHGLMYCPISGFRVCNYRRYDSDIALSNGYLYDTDGLLQAISSNQPLPNLPNISEFDIAYIRNKKERFAHLSTVFSILIGVGALVVTLFSILIFAPALPALAMIGIAFAVGLGVGAISIPILKAIYTEPLRSDLVPTYSSAIAYRELGVNLQRDNNVQLAAEENERLEQRARPNISPIALPASRSAVGDSSGRNLNSLLSAGELASCQNAINSSVKMVVDTLQRYPRIVRQLSSEIKESEYVIDAESFIQYYQDPTKNLMGLLKSRFRDDININDMNVVENAFADFKKAVNSSAYQDKLKAEEERKIKAMEEGQKRFNDRNDNREHRVIRIQAGLDPKGSSDSELAEAIKQSVAARRKF